jgi:hypothetical protein
MKWLTRLPLFVAVGTVACGGGADDRHVFERAQETFSHVRTLRVHVLVNAHMPIERTVTVPASAVPLQRLHVTRWLKHPRRYDCDPGLECARADLDVESAARELEPVLPKLPFDPGSVDAAKLEISIGKDDGVLRRARLQGDLLGLQFEADLTATPK